MSLLRDERGVALPLALMVLVPLVSLTAAFVALSVTEPVISTNLKSADQALALAEAGIERSIWALSPTPTGAPAPNGIATPLAGPAGPPYDGWTLFTLTAAGGAASLGEYTVQVGPAAKSNEVVVTGVGWIPDKANPQATRTVRVTLTSLANRFRPPGALNVNGEARVSGSATIAASGNVCHTSTPASGTYSAGVTAVGGSAEIYVGADCDGANCSDKHTHCTSPSCLQSQPNAAQTFQDLKFTQDEINMLKDLAKAAKTYWGPGLLGPVTGSYDGNVNFNTGNPLPNGIVFVDTESGAPPSVAALSDLAEARVTTGGGDFSGWLIIMGSLDLSGNKTYNGLIYIADDLTAGNGTATVNGALIAHNINNLNATEIDTSANGNIAIEYDCTAIDGGGGKIPQGFLVKPGTWREVSG
jgi:hypothetical protein